MDSPKNNPWYHAGLAFTCLQCGNCCAGPQEGYVWISRSEIVALADYLEMTAAELKEKYLRRVRLRYSLIEKQPGKDCIFLSAQPPQSRSCLIYPVRPLQCRTWPFWKENLRSASAWRRAAAKCPGIDRGAWYDCRRIDALRAGDLSQPSTSLSVEQAAVNWIKNNLDNDACTRAVRKIYQEIDRRLEAADTSCENCGRCCDFAHFGHRLFATTLEMLFFLQGFSSSPTASDSLQLKPMINDRCPYQQPQGCAVRPYRPTSCRIYYCRDLDPAFQNELTEQLLQRLRCLHQQFRAVYYYADLAQWLAIINRPIPKNRSQLR